MPWMQWWCVCVCNMGRRRSVAVATLLEQCHCGSTGAGGHGASLLYLVGSRMQECEVLPLG
eukprot:2518222-Amphidinium_carterae.1